MQFCRVVSAVHHQLEAEHKLLEQKLKATEDNQVKLDAQISKLTNDHNEEVKRLKKERDDVEAKANSSELNSLPAMAVKVDAHFPYVRAVCTASSYGCHLCRVLERPIFGRSGSGAGLIPAQNPLQPQLSLDHQSLVTTDLFANIATRDSDE